MTFLKWKDFSRGKKPELYLDTNIAFRKVLNKLELLLLHITTNICVSNVLSPLNTVTRSFSIMFIFNAPHHVRVLHPVHAVPVSQIRVSGLVIVTGVRRFMRVGRCGGID